MTHTVRQLVIVGLLLPCWAGAAGAQSGPTTRRTRAVDASVPTVGAIVFRRQNVFDSTEATNWITRLANRLHVETRTSVVRRELLFHPGEPFDSSLVAESARNLRQLGIFRDVTIDTVRTASGLVARVTTKDGWTTALDYSIETAGTQVAWSTEFLESNFLGNGSRVLVKYAHDVDRSASRFEFTWPRLIANAVGTALYYERRSDGHQSNVGISRPFVSLESPVGADIAFSEFDGRVFRFTGGQAAASDTIERRLTLLRLHAAKAWRASTGGYLRIGLTAQVRRDDAVAESDSSPIPHTVTAAVGPSIEWQHARYVVTRSFEHFGPQEDVDLSTRVRVELLAAPRAFGYAHDGIGPAISMRLGVPIPGGFGFVEGRSSGIFSAAGLDSGTTTIGATAVLSPGSIRQRVLLHAEGSWGKNLAIGSDFDLGFGVGPRAFRSHAFTGDRSWFTTAEYRYTLFPEMWKLAGLGVAAFADHGGAWFAGSAERRGTDVGVGLRIGPTRQADLRTIRIDLARRFANDVEGAGWVVVVGKGFTFGIAQ